MARNGNAQPGGVAPGHHAARGQGGGRRRAGPPRPALRLRRPGTPRCRRRRRGPGAGSVRRPPRRRVRARPGGGIRALRAARLVGEGGLHRAGVATRDRRAVPGRRRPLRRRHGRRPTPRRAAAACPRRGREDPQAAADERRNWCPPMLPAAFRRRACTPQPSTAVAQPPGSSTLIRGADERGEGASVDRGSAGAAGRLSSAGPSGGGGRRRCGRSCRGRRCRARRPRAGRARARGSARPTLDVGQGGWRRYPRGPAFLRALGEGRAAHAVWQALPGEAWADRLADAAQATAHAGRGALLVVPDQRDVDVLRAACAARLGGRRSSRSPRTSAPPSATADGSRCAVGRSGSSSAPGRRRSRPSSRPGCSRSGTTATTRTPNPAPRTRTSATCSSSARTRSARRCSSQAMRAPPKGSCSSSPDGPARSSPIVRPCAPPCRASSRRARAISSSPVIHWPAPPGSRPRRSRRPAPRWPRDGRCWSRPRGRATCPGCPALLAGRRPAAAGAPDPSACPAAWPTCRARRPTPSSRIFPPITRHTVPAPILLAAPRTGPSSTGTLGPSSTATAEPRRAADPASAASPSCRWCGRVESAYRCGACGSRRLRAGVIGSRRTAEELGRAFPGVPVRTSGGGAPVLDTVAARPEIVVATPGAEPRARRTAPLCCSTGGRCSPGRTCGWPRRRCGGGWRPPPWSSPHTEGGRVLVMADPGLPPVQALVRWDPAGHAAAELAARTEVGFPPAVRMAAIDAGPAALKDLLDELTAELPPRRARAGRARPGARRRGPKSRSANAHWCGCRGRTVASSPLRCTSPRPRAPPARRPIRCGSGWIRPTSGDRPGWQNGVSRS